MRNKRQAKEMETTLNLFASDNRLVISVVSVGEIKSIAKQNQWGKRRMQDLENLLADFLIADINNEAVLEQYALVDTFSQGKLQKGKKRFTARNMGKNDLWIAATASVLGATLLTTDKDFEHLNGIFLKVNCIPI